MHRYRHEPIASYILRCGWSIIKPWVIVTGFSLVVAALLCVRL